MVFAAGKTETTLALATVGVGSNQGDREAVIQDAIESIIAAPENNLKACSFLYETEPYGLKEQQWFYNCVIQVETKYSVKNFFSLLQQTETLFGRVRLERWGPRVLDLDLLLFSNMIYRDADLIIPHPGITERRFVLEPLCEIAPDLLHPALHQSIKTLHGQLTDTSRVICLRRRPVIIS